MIDLESEKLREALADQEHDRWSRWMKHLFRKCWVGDPKTPLRGCLVIPADFVRRWQRQVNTSYADLSEKERDSDRKEADKTIELMRRLQ